MDAEVTLESGPFGPVVRPKVDTSTVVLYLHHGQSTTAGPDGAIEVARRLAARTASTVVCVDYRHALSEALEDVIAAYRHWREQGPVAVAGERFGAWLVAALLLRLRDEGEQLPQCTVLVGALLDLSLESRSLRLQAGVDPMFDVENMRQRVADWVRDPQSSDAMLNPLTANLHGLPPTQLLVAATDPLLDDSLAFSHRAAHDRVPIDLRVTPDREALHHEVVPAAVPFLRRWLAPTTADLPG